MTERLGSASMRLPRREYDTVINASMYYLSVRVGMLIIRRCTVYTVKTGLFFRKIISQSRIIALMGY